MIIPLYQIACDLYTGVGVRVLTRPGFLSTMFWTRNEPQLVLGTYGPLGMFKCRLPLDRFDTHMYVVGKTKKGKSKFLENVAYQLITCEQGCGLLDPHSDLADDLLAYLSSGLDDKEFRRRIIYFEPGEQ